MEEKVKKGEKWQSNGNVKKKKKMKETGKKEEMKI